MARVQYGGGVTEFAGSIAGNTFQRNRSGQIARSRTTRPSRTTPLMSVTQQQTYALTVAWRALSGEQQGLWNDFADAHTRINLFGQERRLSGFNWFTSINSNLVLLGSATLPAPPDYTSPTVISAAELVAVGFALSLDYTLEAPPDHTALVILSTPPMFGTTLSFRQLLRQTTFFEPQQSQDYDFSPSWEATHGLDFPPSDPAAFNVGAVAYTIQTETGIASVGTILQTKWAAA